MALPLKESFTLGICLWLLNTATFSQHIREKCFAVKSKIFWVLSTFKTREYLPTTHPVEDTNYVPFGLLQPAVVTQQNGRHSILRTPLGSCCKEDQRKVCSIILGATYQVEAWFPGTASRTLPSHLCLEDYRGTCSKFWLHPPFIQGLKAWSRVQSSPPPPPPPPPHLLVLLVLSKQSGYLISLSRSPPCSMCYPRTCGICLATLLRGLSVNWTATCGWLLNTQSENYYMFMSSNVFPF